MSVSTTSRTRECINRAMCSRGFLFNLGPKDRDRRFWITINIERLMERDRIWKSNTHRENPTKTCECQYCNQWRDE